MLKDIKRKVAFLLTCFILATALPAKVLGAGEGPSLEALKSLNTKKEGKIIGEVTEKRERNTKHFIKDDYTYEADVYPYAVHYIKDGKWEDIDNSLAEGIDEENNPILQNKENDFNVKFAKKSDSKKLVRIQKDKYEISWGLENSSAIDSKINQKNTDSSLTGNEKQKSLENIISSVEYSGIKDNVDLHYKLLGDIVKENIIIKDKVDSPKFVFNLITKNLMPKLQKDNSVIFYDNNEADKAVFKMEAPYMYDASHEESSKVEINLDEEGNGYKLSLTPDNEWLSSVERKFPVTIDPPVSTSLVRQDIHDAHVSSNYSGTNYENSYILKTGLGSSSGVNRTYIAFTLPTLSSADLVTDAVLGLYNVNSSSSTKQVNVHKVNGAWSSSSITYSNAPGYDSKIIDYQLISSSGFYYWHITPIVKAWYTTGNNTGLMIKNQDEGTGYTEYYASDTSSAYTNLRAQVTINYVNNSGLENYWTYHSVSAGRAGTGYINDYNGNLIFTHDDLSMNGNRMPIGIKHVYNSNDKAPDKNIYYGYGWRLNLSQRVEAKTFSDRIQRYMYTDEDGTKHYFKADSTGVYKDESGVDLTLELISGGGYRIKDKGGNILEFTASGYLYILKDKNGNTATLSYNGATLEKITDGAGRITTLDINQYGYLIGIIDPSARRTSFGYNGAQLTTITYPDGKQTTYTYDSSNTLLSSTNYDGYKISYEYYTASPYRVNKIKESGLSGTTTVAGNELSLSYGYNQTTFTDVSGKKETYIFNNSGNTTCVKDNDGNAQYSKYLNSNINKLQISSKLQGTVTNYLRNHNLEISQSNWNSDYWTGSTGTSAFTTEDKYMGNQSMKVNKTNTSSRQFFNQTLSLTKGKTYTFSAYVKTSSISNTSGQGAALFINYQDSTGYYPTIESRFISGTATWQRVEVKFTLPADSVSNTVYARAGIIGETGSAYFDCLQLEDGNIANRYNLTENASFSYGSPTPELWSRNSELDSTDAIASIDGRTAFKINGEAASNKGLYQVINVSGNAGDAFVLSGWGKGNSVPLLSGRYFAIDIGIQKTDNTYQWAPIQFNEDSSEWQYISDVVIANGAYKSISLYIIYYGNANTAYFDDIQLYKEEFGTSYQYDSKGNVVSTVDLAKQKSTFEYNTNNDLIKATDPKGGLFTYEYSTDGKRNLTKATSAENVVYAFTYDSYGNPKTSKVGDSTTFMQSSAAYTSDGNYIDTLTDSEGNTVNYDYNTTKGTLNSISDANSKVTTYGYDTIDRLTSISKVASGVTITNSYAYINDRISTITHNGFNYNFGYDALGNNTTVSAGSQNLVTNTYEAKTSKLLKSTYGNGQYVSNDYDNLDRAIAKRYNGNVRYKYEYDASGNVGYHDDLVNGVNYRYVYDVADRLVKVNDSDGNSLSYEYDLNNNESKVNDNVNRTTYSTSYGYDKDNKPTSITYSRAASNSLSLAYDVLGRIKSKSVSIGGATTPQFVTTYSYLAGLNGATTNKVSTINNDGSSISYTYDKNGNIKTITEGGKLITYTYNELNELTREDNQVLNKTITYLYDAGGNIKSKVEYSYTIGTPGTAVDTINYTYGDTNWKDKLTSFDGKNITYDAIGNPLTYDGYTYTWEEGRQLKTITGNSKNISYKYNDSGIRTEKNVGGVVTEYHLVGDKVTYETNGTDKVYYTYDSSVNLVSMSLNGVEYYYIRNAQGDIIGLFDNAGTQVVSYVYDSWGKLISTTGTLASTVGLKNPYRYRGYRYDTETGLYYLQSRYYSPDWERFINADSYGGKVGELLSHNVFAYSMNNPINMRDSNGFSARWQNGDEGTGGGGGGILLSIYYAVTSISNKVSSFFRGGNVAQKAQTAERGAERTSQAIEEIAATSQEASKGFKTLNELGLKNGSRMNAEEILDSADQFLGKGYVDAGGGRYVSADGTRVFRMGSNDLLGKHAGGPHVNFETLIPNPAKPGKMIVDTDIHIFLK